jgi:hypothetical protein
MADHAADLGRSVGAGDGNRTRMTSLDGVPHRAVTVPGLRISVTGGTPYQPVLTLANGTPMAR